MPQLQTNQNMTIHLNQKNENLFLPIDSPNLAFIEDMQESHCWKKAMNTVPILLEQNMEGTPTLLIKKTLCMMENESPWTTSHAWN